MSDMNLLFIGAWLFCYVIAILMGMLVNGKISIMDLVLLLIIAPIAVVLIPFFALLIKLGEYDFDVWRKK